MRVGVKISLEEYAYMNIIEHKTLEHIICKGLCVVYFSFVWWAVCTLVAM